MKNYRQLKGDPGEFIRQTLEKEAEQKIFTMRVLENSPDNEKLEILVVFEDKSILNAEIKVGTIDGQISARIKGNYI